MTRLRTISVTAPARLHMGFIDLNGGLGRKFGGFGLALDGVETRLSVSQAQGVRAEGPSAARAEAISREVLDALGIGGGVRVTIEQAIPEHAGLGSGTQLALALSAAISRLYGCGHELAELARLTGRGQRSGIGIGAFAHGGFVVDGGRGPQTSVPPILARADFPEQWRVLVVLDAQVRGLSGRDEQAAFDQLEVMPPECCAHLSRVLLMRILPAIMEADFQCFAEGIGEVQQTVGRYFAGFQRGLYASERVAAVMDLLQAGGAAGVGQSSWGPTGFALAEDAAQAGAMLAAVNERFGEIGGVRCRILGGRNRGGELLLEDHALKAGGNLREL